jgi:hypothetical protein
MRVQKYTRCHLETGYLLFFPLPPYGTGDARSILNAWDGGTQFDNLTDFCSPHHHAMRPLEPVAICSSSFFNPLLTRHAGLVQHELTRRRFHSSVAASAGRDAGFRQRREHCVPALRGRHLLLCSRFVLPLGTPLYGGVHPEEMAP